MRLTLCCALVCLLVGCSASDESDLQSWMNEQRAQTKPKVAPLAEPKKFVPQDYNEEGVTDPFNILKLTQALRKESAQAAANAALVAPELTRRKEALEAYPLDSMTMVGSLIKVGMPVALVKVDNLLYQVKLGNYLGQNYGRVMKISETELGLREIVQDSSGEWVERVATLQLQEKSK